MANDYIVHKAIESSALSAKQAAAIPENQGWVLSPKYDGCHAIICFDKGQHVGTFSRTGEQVFSLNHIGRGLLLHYPEIAEGRWAICGEAWHPAWEFNRISGAFRRQDKDAAELYFVPFDLVPWDYNDEGFSSPVILLNPTGGGPGYAARATALQSRFQPAFSQVVRPKVSIFVGSLGAVLAEATPWANELKQLGTYDGVIVAKADGQYKVGAGKGGEFLKVKPLLSETVTVAGYEEAVGEKTGKRTVALTFQLANRQQRVSTGLTQAQVEDICDNFAANWRGKRIEVEAMGITVNGFLREPRFKGIRND